jgi:hypothetical protein
MKSIVRILMCSLLLLPGVTLDAEGALNGSCAADVAKYCKGVEPGGGRVTACLKEHEAELSAECRDEQKAMQWRTRRAPADCADDVVQFCADVRPVDRRIIRCLLQNDKVLSSECRDRLNAGRKTEQE